MIIRTYAELKKHIDKNSGGGRIGRVGIKPGIFHEGHTNLISETRKYCDYLVGISTEYLYDFKSKFEEVPVPIGVRNYIGSPLTIADFSEKLQELCDVVFWPDAEACLEFEGIVSDLRVKVGEAIQGFDLPIDDHDRKNLLSAACWPLGWKYYFGINVDVYANCWKDGYYRFLTRDILNNYGITSLLVDPVRDGYIPFSSGMLEYADVNLQDVLRNEVQLIETEYETAESIEQKLSDYPGIILDKFEKHIDTPDVGLTYIWCEVRVSPSETAVQDARIF